MYLLNARTLLRHGRGVEADAKTKARVRFAVQQWIDAAAPSNFLALNPEAQKKAHRDQGREHRRRACSTCCNDMQQGHVSQTDESAFEVGRNVATTEGAVVFENELFQLHRIQAAHGQGARAAVAVRAAVHQQVLHPRPAARELADPLRGRAGPPRLRAVSWRNPDEAIAQLHLGRLHRATARSRRIDVVQEISGAEADQHARLLRRRHDPRHRAGGAGGARRAAGGEHDAADHAARLQRHRRARHLHRRSRRCRCAR